MATEEVTAQLGKLSVTEEREKKEQQSQDGRTEIRTCLIYDARMMDHVNPSHSGHPEQPLRILRIWEALEREGYVGRCGRLKARDATKSEIVTLHTEEHFEKMASLPQYEIDDLVRMSYAYSSIFLNKFTFPCALLSAGCVVELTEHVITGKARNGIAVVRPPGHHAEESYCMGFCVFNNVGVAAKVALETHGLKRILIVDWDVHHGNATQNQFYDDKRVLYVSLHRYDNATFYPGRKEADHTHTGGGGAKGYNVNVAWNNESMGDAEYLSAFHHVILPIAYEYNPELVIISCGFDSAQGDPLGRYRITPAGFGHMTHLLMGLAGGKVVIALEGGYNLASISESMCVCAAALLGDPLPSVQEGVPNDSAVVCIQRTARSHANYWKSLRMFQDKAETGKSDKRPVGSQDSPVEELRPNITREQEPVQSHEQIATPTQSCDQATTPSQAQDQGVVVPTAAEGASAEGTGQKTTNERVVESLEQEGHTYMFVVTPKPWCPHLPEVNPVPGPTLDASQTCETCGEAREPWICLTCYHVYCGRYIHEHMVNHCSFFGHSVSLSIADLSVWCNTCDSYVDNEVVRPAKDALHRSKFGCSMDGTPA